MLGAFDAQLLLISKALHLGAVTDWTIRTIEVRGPAIATLREVSWSLILIDAALPDAHTLAHDVRTHPYDGPVVALAAAPSINERIGPAIDGVLGASHVIAGLAAWHHGDRLAPAHRMAAVFGPAPIVAGLRGLRAQLAAALASPAIDQAHRLAGLAGTLGLAAASAAWHRVAEGEANAIDAARRESRIAIAAIDAATRVSAT